MLWGGGSVLPVDSVAVDGDQLVLKRKHPRPERSRRRQVT